MANAVVRLFPILILLSSMALPQLVHFSMLSLVVVPMLFLIWVFFLLRTTDLYIDKFTFTAFLLLLFGQCLLWFLGDVKEPYAMLLGLVWIFTAFLIFSLMGSVSQYLDDYFYVYLVVAVIWLIVAWVVWSGLTHGQAITVAGISISHVAQLKPSGPFTNGNVFGIMMVSAWIVGIKYWLDKKKPALMFFLAFLFLTAVFVSMSRGAWLAGSVVFVGLLLRLLWTKKWGKGILLFASLPAAWFVGIGLVDTVNAGMMQERAEHMITLGARQVLYPSVLEVWKANILTGVGLGNLLGHYLTAQANVLPLLPQTVYGLGATFSAHNHLLHILSAAGLFGLPLWLITAYVLFKYYIKNAFNYTSKAWAPLSIAMVLWIQGLFNISMTEALPFFWFFVCLGLGVHLQSTNREKTTKLFLSRNYLSAGVLIVVFMLVLQSYSMINTWKTYETLLNSHEGYEKGQLVGKLLGSGSDVIYPYTINKVVSDLVAVDNKNIQVWAAIQPNIEHALALEEWPTLYQALFYSYVTQEKWDKACDLGKFLKQQHWQNDKNSNAYDQSCQQKGTEDFTLGW